MGVESTRPWETVRTLHLIPIKYEPCAAILARWKRKRANHECPQSGMTVEEIAASPGHRPPDGLCRMLEQGIIPAIRLGRRWIVTRHAFENWERTCGMPTGLQRKTEHKVT